MTRGKGSPQGSGAAEVDSGSEKPHWKGQRGGHKYPTPLCSSLDKTSSPNELTYRGWAEAQ